MLTISADPMLIGSDTSESIKRRTPMMASSTKRKLLVCWPSPHTSISWLAPSRWPPCGRSPPAPLAPTGPGALGAEHVVVAGDLVLNARVLAEVAAHPLGEQLLPAVPVLGVGRVGVGFLERDDVCVGLESEWVHAGRRGEEVSLDAGVRAPINRWVFINTESMHNALLSSMKPIPPMSHARLYTWSHPVSDSATSSSDTSPTTFSALSWTCHHSDIGLMSTTRTSKPSASSDATRCPPMNPPPPATSAFTRSSTEFHRRGARRRPHPSAHEKVSRLLMLFGPEERGMGEADEDDDGLTLRPVPSAGWTTSVGPGWWGSMTGSQLRAWPSRAPEPSGESATNPNLVRILDGDLGLLPDPRPQGIEETRRTFIAMLDADGPRRAEAWRQAVADLDHPETLVVSVCNAAFLLFLERWLSSCDQRSIEVRSRTVIVTLDSATASRCREIGLTSVAANGEDRDHLASVVGWNDERFSRLVPWKSVATWDALHLAQTVLFQDVDVLWLRDPIADLAGQQPEVDVLVMYDGPNPHFAPLHVNSGFVHVQAGDATRSLWETMVGNAASIVHLGSEQLVLNRVLEAVPRVQPGSGAGAARVAIPQRSPLQPRTRPEPGGAYGGGPTVWRSTTRGRSILRRSSRRSNGSVWPDRPWASRTSSGNDRPADRQTVTLPLGTVPVLASLGTVADRLGPPTGGTPACPIPGHRRRYVGRSATVALLPTWGPRPARTVGRAPEQLAHRQTHLSSS